MPERILADELAGAFDVYDVEPLPPDGPPRDRANVVHTPHIAGRTRDANLRVADVIADDFGRIPRGEAPHIALTPDAIRVRTEDIAVPGAWCTDRRVVWRAASRCLGALAFRPLR